jgi:hypothetical protein
MSNAADKTTGFLVFGLVLGGAMPKHDAAHKYGARIGDRTLWFTTAKAATAAAKQVGVK